MASLIEKMDEVIAQLERSVQNMFHLESSGHDIHHLKRTMNLALHIQKKEGGNKLVIAAASLLHDVHRIIQNKTGKYCTPGQSLPEVKILLMEAGIGWTEEGSHIVRCIAFHEEYDFSDAGKTAKDIETLIVQDADNLDAIGAIGIARIFSYGGAHGIPIWRPEIPIDKESNWDETKPTSPSQIQHFYEKLLRLKDNMNTATAKKMAAHRHKVMEAFLAEFFKEWEGKL